MDSEWKGSPMSRIGKIEHQESLGASADEGFPAGGGRRASQVVVAERLRKVFHTSTRRPGLRGAVRSLVNPSRSSSVAVEDVSFVIGRGELLALLGPNGAGKSTTIKMLTGILNPTSGCVHVAGISPHRQRIRNSRNVGVVFGHRTQLWWDLPARESFRILGDIYSIPVDEYDARLRDFDKILELRKFWSTSVRHLSLGERVRCDLAAALLHDPTVVFLDEPTIGMDVVAKEQVREFLRHQAEHRGRTILLTTHDMTEVSRLAERIVLINHGRVVLDGTLQDLLRKVGDTWRINVVLGSEQEAPGQGKDATIAGIRMLGSEGSRITFGPDASGGSSLQEALRQILRRFNVVDLAIVNADLEDVMRDAYRQGQRS
jgi:viologen exporter family transport system ATP-binding protein